MIIWNFDKWYDKFLAEHTEEQLKEFFAWSFRRRERLRLAAIRKAMKEVRRVWK